MDKLKERLLGAKVLKDLGLIDRSKYESIENAVNYAIKNNHDNVSVDRLIASVGREIVENCTPANYTILQDEVQNLRQMQSSEGLDQAKEAEILFLQEQVGRLKRERDEVDIESAIKHARTQEDFDKINARLEAENQQTIAQIQLKDQAIATQAANLQQIQLQLQQAQQAAVIGMPQAQLNLIAAAQQAQHQAEQQLLQANQQHAINLATQQQTLIAQSQTQLQAAQQTMQAATAEVARLTPLVAQEQKEKIAALGEVKKISQQRDQAEAKLAIAIADRDKTINEAVTKAIEKAKKADAAALAAGVPIPPPVVVGGPPVPPPLAGLPVPPPLAGLPVPPLKRGNAGLLDEIRNKSKPLNPVGARVIAEPKDDLMTSLRQLLELRKKQNTDNIAEDAGAEDDDDDDEFKDTSEDKVKLQQQNKERAAALIQEQKEREEQKAQRAKEIKTDNPDILKVPIFGKISKTQYKITTGIAEGTIDPSTSLEQFMQELVELRKAGIFRPSQIPGMPELQAANATKNPENAKQLAKLLAPSVKSGGYSIIGGGVSDNYIFLIIAIIVLVFILLFFSSKPSHPRYPQTVGCRA